MLQPERMSFALGRAARFNSDGRGASTLGAPRQPQRRLADSVHEAFHLALFRGDVTTAEELLGVLESLCERDRVKSGTDRRGGAALLQNARQELAAKKAARYTRT